MDPMLEKLINERASFESRIDAVKSTAADQDRDLTPTDLESLDKWHDRIAEIDKQIDSVSRTVEMSTDARARIAAVSGGTAPASYRSAGQLMWDVLHQNDGDARSRYQRAQRDAVHNRAAEHMGTEADKTVAVAGGFGGLIVAETVGPIIDLHPATRPLLTAIGMQTVPSAEFRRPRIVDANFATGVGPQGLQKEELVSKAFNVASDPVDFQTIGGYLNVSAQVLRYVPSGLEIITSQLLKRLAAAAENAAVAEMDKTTATVELASDADGGAVRQAIFDASALVYANTGQMATTIAMGPAGWSRLGGLTDLALRPLFPLGPRVNSLGEASPGTFEIAGLGLSAVVTPAITDDSFYVFGPVGVEAYWSPYPVLEAVEPSVLGRQVAVAADVGFYQVPTTEGDPASYEAVVRIGTAPTPPEE